MIRVTRKIVVELELDEEDAKKFYLDLNTSHKRHQVTTDVIELLEAQIYSSEPPL